MEGLRSDQAELLSRHREEAFDALVSAAAVYEGTHPLRDTPEGRELLSAPKALQVSIAVSAAAASVERRRIQQAQVDAEQILRIESSDVFPVQVLAALKRRRLPFASEDVELVLDLGTSTMRQDDVWGRSFETLAFGVAAAASLLRDEPARAELLAALERAGSAIEQLSLDPTSDAGALRRRIGALVTANAPGGLLDLSFIDEHDGWGAGAREIFRAHAARRDGVQALLAHLAAVRGSHPSKRWSAATADLLAANGDSVTLLQELLEPVLEIDLVPTPTDVPWPPSWLLAPSNETVLCGAAWALRGVDAPWVVQLLGRLALRCCASSPDAAVTTALSAPVGSGAIDSLIARSDVDAEARNELIRLLGEIRRRDVLKRIAAAVGEKPAQTAARDASIRRTKERAVRAKADPGPAREQRVADGVVRDELAPHLRAIGFTTRRGRTFWRRHPNRVEVVQLSSIRGELVLRAGVWFVAPRRLFPAKAEDGRPHPAESHCDLRASFADDPVLEACRRAEAWFTRWQELHAVLEFLLSDESDDETWGHGAPESAMRSYLIGYLALAVGRSDLTQAHLTQAAAWFRESLEERGASYATEVVEQHRAFIAGLEEDARSG